jgi:energy-coupling factor transport system ATP-binding protein
LLEVKRFEIPLGDRALVVQDFSLARGSVNLITGDSAAPVHEVLLALSGLRGVLEYRLKPVGQGLAPPKVNLTPTLEGRVLLGGRDLNDLPGVGRAATAAIIFENPEWGFLCSTVEEDFNYTFAACGLEPPPPYTLRRYGLFEARSIAPEYLSGGEQQRLACAAVMERPVELVLADFSSANLDQHFRNHVLRPWVERASHDGTVFIIRGLSEGDLPKVTGNIHVTQSLVAFENHPAGYKSPSSQAAVAAIEKAVRPRTANTDKAIVMKADQFRSPFSKGPLSLELRGGELKLLVGPNGAGKTTFGRSVVEQRRQNGRLYVSPGTVPAMSVQNPERSLFSNTVLRQLRRDKKLISMCGLNTADHTRHPLSLPRAKQKLVSVASALQRSRALAILDEPTLGLDLADYELFSGLLDEFPDLSVLIMTHDRLLMKTCTDTGVEVVDLEIVR